MIANKIKFLSFALFFLIFNVYSQENVVQGPFKLKGASNVSIRYVKNSDESISFVSNYKIKDCVVDNYAAGDGVPDIETVFFTNISKMNNIVSLVSWDEGNINAIHYKVFAYTYTNNGVVKLNEKITSDENLEGYDGYNGNGAVFDLKNSDSIKSYLKRTYE